MLEKSDNGSNTTKYIQQMERKILSIIQNILVLLQVLLNQIFVNPNLATSENNLIFSIYADVYISKYLTNFHSLV